MGDLRLFHALGLSIPSRRLLREVWRQVAVGSSCGHPPSAASTSHGES